MPDQDRFDIVFQKLDEVSREEPSGQTGTEAGAVEFEEIEQLRQLAMEVAETSVVYYVTST